MTIRIGANPIGRTNDDLQEIGGSTPLETCLKEAREAGVEGMEKGHKMPAFMAHTKPPVHLLLDTGHALWGGADPAALAAAYRERIGHVHCNDARGKKMREANARDLSFLDSILGEGMELGVYTVPRRRHDRLCLGFKALEGYSGWVVLEAEQDPEKAPSPPYAKKGVAHIRAALKESGLG
jgi:sugar phosphate isomerase/epimerase